MKLHEFKIIGVFALIVTLFLTLSACDMGSDNTIEEGTSTYKKYNVVVEVVDAGTKEGLKNVNVTIKDAEGNEQNAKATDKVGVYEFEDIKLEDNKEFLIEIDKDRYSEKEVTAVAGTENISLTDKEAIELVKSKDSITESIDEEGGEVSLNDGTTLTIPKGAVEEEVEITLEYEDNTNIKTTEITKNFLSLLSITFTPSLKLK